MHITCLILPWTNMAGQETDRRQHNDDGSMKTESGKNYDLLSYGALHLFGNELKKRMVSFNYKSHVDSVEHYFENPNDQKIRVQKINFENQISLITNESSAYARIVPRFCF